MKLTAGKNRCGVRREVGVLRKNQKEMLEIRNTMTSMKTTFDGLISRPDLAEERTAELELSIECSRTEKQREQKTENKPIFKDCGTRTKGIRCVMGIVEGKERDKRIEEIFGTVMTEDFPK